MSTTDVPSTPIPAVAVGGVDVLSGVRQARQESDAAEVRVLVGTVDWAAQNPPLFAREASAWYAWTTQGAAPEKDELTADGVPDVDRAAVAELGLALGVSTQSAQALIADGLELAYRLPMVWTRVVAGEVKPWKARRIAQASRPLSKQAAAYMDRQVASLADRVNGPQLDGLIAAAMAKHDQELAARIAAERAELRRFDILLSETTLSGLTSVSGNLDLPDAQDLDVAVAHAATQLAAWGSEDNLNVRRARALGELARDYLAFTGDGGPDDQHDDDWADEASTDLAADDPARLSGTDGNRRNRGVRVPSKNGTQCPGVPIGRIENTDTRSAPRRSGSGWPTRKQG